MDMDNFNGVLLVLMMSNVFLDVANTSITRDPVNTDVMVGHSTFLNCSTSDSSTEIHWYHYPIGAGTKDHEYVYAHGRMHPPYANRFRIDKNTAPGSFDLVMTQVEFQDAGLYVCQNGGGAGQLISAQLIVLDSPLSCESNINPDGLIGPNTCGLQTDKFQLSCRVDFHGNIHPALVFTRDGQSILPKAVCNNSATGVTECRITLGAEINMDGSTFVCQTTRAAQDQYNCTTDKVKVLYAVSEKEPVEKTIGDIASCSAKANSPSCSYKWIWFDGVSEKTISSDQNLKLEQQGWHRCEANCKIKENQCAVVPMLVKASSALVPAVVSDSKVDVIIAVVVTFLLCAVIAAIPGYIVWKKMTGETKALRVSVESLQEKDDAWKEENSRMQEQLRQVEQLTATLLEKHTDEHSKQTDTEMERQLEELRILMKNARRGASKPEKALLVSNDLCGNIGSTPRGAKNDKQYHGMIKHDNNASPFIAELYGEVKLKMEKRNSQDENLPLFPNNNTNEDRGDDWTNATFGKTQMTANKQEIADVKINGFGRMVQ